MKIGDLVTIYYGDSFQTTEFFVDTQGIILEICGHKCDVLVDGNIEKWDYADLVYMRKDKHENR